MHHDVLLFDRLRSCFYVQGVSIGRRTDTAGLVSGYGAEPQPMPEDVRWSFLQLDTRPIGVFVTLFEGRVHSGYFWAYVESGGWDDYERAEDLRRAEHVRLMHGLFESDRFENEAMLVDLVRDPRSGLEQIRFQVK